MKDNVISLSDKTNDNRFISVEQLLKETYKEVRDDNIKPTRAVVILLHDKDDVYATKMRSANISNSQIISLLELRKHICLERLA